MQRVSALGQPLRFDSITSVTDRRTDRQSDRLCHRKCRRFTAFTLCVFVCVLVCFFSQCGQLVGLMPVLAACHLIYVFSVALHCVSIHVVANKLFSLSLSCAAKNLDCEEGRGYAHYRSAVWLLRPWINLDRTHTANTETNNDITASVHMTSVVVVIKFMLLENMAPAW